MNDSAGIDVPVIRLDLELNEILGETSAGFLREPALPDATDVLCKRQGVGSTA